MSVSVRQGFSMNDANQSELDDSRVSEPDGPPLLRDGGGSVDYDSIPDVIQWFLDHDQRVAIVKHPRVEELFQWKQQESQREGEEVFVFNRAEDRLAIGIIQALAHNATEHKLHSWIGQLLNALDSAAKSTESIVTDYHLNIGAEASVITESKKIPAATARRDFLLNCWLETLCTAEIRVLGWLYGEFYGRPFHPNNF
jgi:hypothetical protein